MILTDEDYRELASQIIDRQGYAILDKGNEELEIRYKYDEDGYCEDDYYNGTGAWVVTAVYLRVLDVICTNEDGSPCYHDFDENELYYFVKGDKMP